MPPDRFGVAVMGLGSDTRHHDHGHWLTPPWTTDSPAWQDIDQRLDENDLARRIRAVVLGLDLTELRRAYFGVGKRAFPPELMLMVVLYEMHSGQLHPVRWAKDCRWFDPVKWLAMGFEPSPSYFYSFRKRLGAPLRAWNQQVLDRALAEGWTKGDETSIDGTFVAALGSRHRLIKAKTLGATCGDPPRGAGSRWPSGRSPSGGHRQPLRRGGHLHDPRRGHRNPGRQRRAPSGSGLGPGNSRGRVRPPYWMAKTPAGRRRQLYRYRQAQDRLNQLLTHHAQRETHKSKPKRRSRGSGSDRAQ